LKPGDPDASAAARGEKAFSVLDYAIKIVVVTLVVFGLMILIVEVSGVGMAAADEHEILRYRMVAAPVFIIGYLLIDWLLARRRASRLTAAAEATDANPSRAKRGYAVEFMALIFVAGGAAAFWHDHISHEIPRAKAVPATFVSAKCFDRITRRIGGSVAPHMSIIYEYVSLSTSQRVQEMTCLLANCEPDTKPRQYPDTVENRAFYASKAECDAALPAVLAAKAPTTVWTGDKDPNAAVRARFTPEREKLPYFLLWFPGAVAVVMVLISAFARRRRAS
jgi:hypothetical protein